MKLIVLMIQWLPLIAIALGISTLPALAQKQGTSSQPIPIELPAQDQQIFAPEDENTQNETEENLDQELNQQSNPDQTTVKETPAPLQQYQQQESTAPNEQIQIQQR